ncbi:PIR protein [Plasmodium reichenowi]|uniref:PIR protein n=1 Tax=Plasmodium reichenowi TaxID=5854 RepID=A0A2P9DRW5_PLARE|nr:PIR protein [Plasmodium reichenowi]
MKVHYINILLFALPLNILLLSSQAHNKNKPQTTPHTPKITITRLLCECELYAPANYDNDTEMKTVMDNFNKQTQQRFEEYEEHMVEKRKKCKEQCDKEIQKIILKDKLEKQMAEQFSTLETKINTDDIPTCICEKSMADKTEKFCLNCGKTMGGVAPGWGLVSGLMYAGWTNYAATTLVKIATDAGIAEGVKVGLVKVKEIVETLIRSTDKVPAINGAELVSSGYFTDKMSLLDIFKYISSNINGQLDPEVYSNFSFAVDSMANRTLTQFNNWNRIPAKAVASAVADAKEGILAEGASKTSSLTTGITASVVAIVVIILVMLIIYLILRYRRKKKMKKKLQYIKLLE